MAVSEKSIKNIKPPVKGEVRNPNGKPKGTLSAKTIIRKWLESKEKIKNPVGDTSEQTVTVLDNMTLAVIKKALKGDITAFNALLDRTEGKPTQLLGGDDSAAPIQVTLTKAKNCDPLPD